MEPSFGTEVESRKVKELLLSLAFFRIWPIERSVIRRSAIVTSDRRAATTSFISAGVTH